MLHSGPRGYSQEEWRLADTPGSPEIPSVVTIQESHAKVGWRVRYRRNFVVIDGIRCQLGTIVAEFLGSHPTQSLHKPPDNLASVDTGIDSLADIHQQIDSHDVNRTGETIHANLRDCGSGRVVAEGPALAGF